MSPIKLAILQAVDVALVACVMDCKVDADDDDDVDVIDDDDSEDGIVDI